MPARKPPSQYPSPYRLSALALILGVAALAAGCGDSDDPTPCTPGAAGCAPIGDGTAPMVPPPTPNPGPVPTPSPRPTQPAANLPPSSSLANVCTPVGQNEFVRSYLNEQYLWYNELKPVAPAAVASVSDYFYGILADTPDRLGRPKDRFSFILPTTTADALSSGANVGYGMTWAKDAAGRTRVALVTAASPATAAGMARGGELVRVISSTNNSWYPNSASASVTFEYRDTPASAPRQITLNAAAIQDDPLPITSVLDAPGGHKVGYLLFNDHSRGAQDKLIDAVTTLKSGAINDLVIDLRYNGGGYLYVADALASMVAGPAADGKVFERLQYNDKRPNDSANSIFPFITRVMVSESDRHPPNQTLPTLSLPRVYVLTTESTCSASEAIINGLRGIDVAVVQIGGTTCGKPFGFTRKDNCGMAMYPIEFQGTNAKGFGDYAEGFAATCAVPDDFERALGSSSEGMLAAALQHLQTGQCPAVATSVERVKAVPVQGLQLWDKPQLGMLLQ